MRKTQKKLSKRKLLIPIILLVFLFSIIKVGTALASTDSFSITNVEVSAKSQTVDVENLSFERCKIINNVTFHQVGDSITYKIKVKNNEDTSYTIKSVSDDNENKYISYIYDSYEGTKLNSKEETTFEVTEKYVQEIGEMSKRNQYFSVNITFTLEDEQGNVIETVIPVNTSSNPKTGDNVGMYITTSVASLIMLILLSRKSTVKVSNSKIKQIKTKSRKARTNARVMNSTIQTNEFNDISNIGRAARTSRTSRKNKGKHYGKHCGKGFKLFSLFIVGALILPTISKAATNYALTITFENNIALKDKLIVSYNIGDEEYNITTRYNELIPGLVDPEIDGYDFDGWKLEDGTDFDPNTTKITDDTTIVPKFTPKTYTISYDLNGGTLKNENPASFTIESNDIVLNNPTKEGYIFAGWTGTGLTGTVETVTIAKGSMENREYTANWTTADYTITYNLNGGTMAGNPTTYTTETDDIELNNPTKEGYTFTGWTGTELQDKTNDVTIEKGSTGNREYTANWIPTNYTITYKGLTDEEKTALNNPTTYNIETPSITLNNPENRKDVDNDVTQKFVGWKENVTVSTNISIPAELGDKEYEAIWVAVDPNVYTVEYNLDGGTVATANRTSFTKFDTFTLNNPTKQGYTFAGWTGSNGTTAELNVTVPTGIRQNLNYKANWTPINYTITTKYDDGTVIATIPYTIESNDITLETPSKTGYTFKGWTDTDLTEKTMIVTIPKGSTGNREYTANFDANTCTIVFDRNTGSGSMANQTMTYDTETTLNANEFTKTGYTFDGWNTQVDGQGNSYANEQSVKNLVSEQGATVTLYAKWKANDYQVVFNKNNDGATGTMDNQSFEYDETKTLTPNAFTKENYTFKNWNTKEDGTGATYTDGQSVTNLATEGEFNLYAQWEGNAYKVIFDKNDSNATGTMADQYFVYDIEQNLTTNTFTKVGYTFSGWNTESDGSGVLYTDGDSVKNLTTNGYITLYAQYIPNTNTSYKVVHKTMDIDGVNYSVAETESLTGTSDTDVTPDFKSYEHFSNPINKKTEKINPDGSTIIEYLYTRDKYILTLENINYIDMAQSSDSGEHYYGETITLVAVDCDGKIFSKWSNDSEDREISFVISNDITIGPIMINDLPTGLTVGSSVSYAPEGTYLWQRKYAARKTGGSGMSSVDVTLSSAEDGGTFHIDSWKVLDIDEETGNVTLIASQVSSGQLQLDGAQGYNNGIKILNDACNSLYGNSQYGIVGRSINLQDYTSRMSTVYKYNQYMVQKLHETNKNYPTIYALEKNSVIDGNENATGIDASDSPRNESGETIFIDRGDKTDGFEVATTSIYPYNTKYDTYKNIDNANLKRYLPNGYYDLLMPDTSGSSNYWVATRFIESTSTSDKASFSICSKNNGNIEGLGMYNSQGSQYSAGRKLLPIVTLNGSLIQEVSGEYKVVLE